MFQFSQPNAFAISSKHSLWEVSTAFIFKASRKACAMTFASRKSRMRAPLHRRTEKIGACITDPFANGEGGREIDTFTIPGGCRRRVYRPGCELAPWKSIESTKNKIQDKAGQAGGSWSRVA